MISVLTTTDIINMVAGLSSNPLTVMNRCRNMSRFYRSKGKNTGTCDGSDPKKLENEWYESLSTGKPDFGVYTREEFISETVACYLVYSKGFIRNIFKAKSVLPNFSKIVDLGCGVGLTCALLKELFPDKQVIGTQVSGAQYDIAEKIAKQYNFTLQNEIKDVKDSMLIALDYAEHFQEPIEHFKPIFEQKPKVIVMANSFAPKSVGHFDTYYIYDNDQKIMIASKKMGRIFNKWLRGCGYEPCSIRFYNNRPAIYIRKDN